MGAEILRDSKIVDTPERRGSEVGLMHASGNAPWLYRDLGNGDGTPPHG
jgi:hypothetical protein